MRRPVLRISLVATGAVMLGGAATETNGSVTDWSRYAQTAADLLGEQIEREVSIGAIEVETVMPPQLRLRDVRIGNADWGRSKFLADIGEMRVRIDLQQLLGGAVVIPEVVLRQARIALERGPEGKTNWTFGAPTTDDAAAPLPLPIIPVVESLRIEDVALAYVDTSADRTIEATLANLSGSATGEGVRLSGDGTVEDQPLRLDLTADPLESLKPGEPYALKVELRLAENQLMADARIGDPAQLQDVEIDLSARGPGLSTLGAGLVDLPQTAPYRLQARASSEGDAWRLDDIDAALGQTQAVGWAEIDTGGERPTVRAELRVPELHLRDLAPASDLPPEATPAEVAAESQEEPAEPFLIPDAPLPADLLQAADAEIGLVVERADLPAGIEPVEVKLSLQDGALEVTDLRIGVGGGTVVGRMSLTGQGAGTSAVLDLGFNGIELRNAFEGTQFAEQTSGTLRGHVNLRATGDRVHAMLGSLDGEVTALMSEGTLSGLILEGATLDVAEALALYIGEDTPVAVRCLVVDLPIRQGVGEFRRLLLDTADSLIQGAARIDFGRQTVQMRVEGQGKDFSILDPDAPVFAEGPWSDLRISVGPTAFIPLLELGLQEDAPCDLLESDVPTPPPASEGEPTPSAEGGTG